MAIWYIIGAFAVFRMTLDITSTRELDGPFGLYTAVRSHIEGRDYPSWIKDGVVCPWCVSFWFGCFFGVFYPMSGLCEWWMYPVLAAGLSGPSTILYAAVELFTDNVASDL